MRRLARAPSWLAASSNRKKQACSLLVWSSLSGACQLRNWGVMTSRMPLMPEFQANNDIEIVRRRSAHRQSTRRASAVSAVEGGATRGCTARARARQAARTAAFHTTSTSTGRASAGSSTRATSRARWPPGPCCLAVARAFREAPRSAWPWAVSDKVWPGDPPERLTWQSGIVAPLAAPAWKAPKQPGWYHRFCKKQPGGTCGPEPKDEAKPVEDGQRRR